MKFGLRFGLLALLGAQSPVFAQCVSLTTAGSAVPVCSRADARATCSDAFELYTQPAPTWVAAPLVVWELD